MRSNGVKVILNLKLGVAHGVPQHRPDQSASQWVGQTRQVSKDGLRTSSAKSHLGVREIVVVDEDEVGGRFARRLRNRGAWGGDSEVDEVSAHQIFAVQGVQPDAQGVGTIDVAAGADVNRVTHDSQLGNNAITDSKFRQQDVGTSSLKPSVDPGAQITSADLFEVTNEVVKGG